VVPLSNAPARAGDLLTANTIPPGGQEFDINQLMSAPVGRVDAFGVGVDPSAADPGAPQPLTP